MNLQKIPDLVPLPRDARGYCYRNQAHFRAHLRQMADFFSRSQATWWEDWGAFIASMVPLVLVFTMRQMPWWAIIGAYLSLLPVYMWYARRHHRFMKRIVRQRLCFRCGYSLINIGTEGVCPECGNPFDVALYREPPPHYLRTEQPDRDCPRCGEAIPFGFESCWLCGAPLDPGQAPEVEVGVRPSSVLKLPATPLERTRTNHK